MARWSRAAGNSPVAESNAWCVRDFSFRVTSDGPTADGVFEFARLLAAGGWGVAFAVAFLAASIASADNAGVDFAHDVRPILSDKCYRCHGPDEGSREADLRLDLEEGITAGFKGGDFSNSEAWRRIVCKNVNEVMPPADSGKSLTTAELATLRRWMESGAPWGRHWAFDPPRRIDPPEIPGAGALQSIDAFIRRRLAEAGLAAPGPGTKEILIRRLSFDLTGLPPSVEEIEAFLAEDAPDAYERLVDRLLASPHFGERFATIWLDAARYSDTFGYQRDEDRYVWPWRDWVIAAFNDNLPYDEFLRQQLAGDLVENPTTDSILATTFNRLHGQNSEGGSIPEEFRMEYVADRTQTFASAVLGLTMECCRCHDHKYDPLTIKDYYALSGFFDKIDESGISSFFTPTTPPPSLDLATAGQAAEIKRLEGEVAIAERAVSAIVEKHDSRQRVSLSTESKPSPPPVATEEFDGAIKPPNQSIQGVKGRAIQFSGDDEVVAAKSCVFDRADPFSISLWLRVDRRHERAVVYHASQASLDSASRGHELLIEGGRLSAGVIHFWPGNAIRVMSAKVIPLDRWLHVAVTYDGSSRANGIQLYLNGAKLPTEIVRDGLTRTAVDPKVDHIAVGARFRDRGLTGGAVDQFQLYDRRLCVLEVAQLADAPIPPNNASQAYAEFDLVTSSREYKEALEALRARRRALFAAQDEVQQIMVMRQFDGSEPTRVRLRGAFDALGQVVDAAPPGAFFQLESQGPLDRLDLSNWVTDPRNPLTSRVAVNRFWQAVFGLGLVRTPEDFGAQGQPPTHPQLLDNLAVEFVESGWNIKALIKRMVMSETYRQSAVASKQAYEKDPENLLLSRSVRRRWPAEMLRDNALAASGLLVRRVGGPPARPYEVEAAFVRTPRDQGEGLYRRSVYTYFKRSAPAPMLSAFDAPDRSVCRVSREQTNPPTQALVMLNSPQFVEAARVLAERTMLAEDVHDTAWIVSAFRLLTSQAPSREERRMLDRLYVEQQSYYATHPGEAAALLAVGDQPPQGGLDAVRLASATVVTQTIMNFDKCVTRP